MANNGGSWALFKEWMGFSQGSRVLMGSQEVTDVALTKTLMFNLRETLSQTAWLVTVNRERKTEWGVVFHRVCWVSRTKAANKCWPRIEMQMEWRFDLNEEISWQHDLDDMGCSPLTHLLCLVLYCFMKKIVCFLGGKLVNDFIFLFPTYFSSSSLSSSPSSSSSSSSFWCVFQASCTVSPLVSVAWMLGLQRYTTVSIIIF